MIASVACAALIAGALTTTPVQAAEDKCPRPTPAADAPGWPAPPERGAFDIVHFGEGHWNEGQGPVTMPILVQDVVSFSPDFVAFSSDMADIGTLDRLQCFRFIMQPLVDAGIPWFDSPGNHDRVALAGPGGVGPGGIDTWREVFAGMPRPWGDAPPPSRRFRVPRDEPEDGKGASTHYFFDYGARKKPALRLIVLDNSQHALTYSDFDQYPSVGPREKDASQFTFLHRAASEAAERGLLTLVVMHQPTRDPRDPSNVHPISINHTMSKGLSADNVTFELVAQQTGVDAVLLGHIQGNAVYSVGDTQYFIDGGGGGTPYAAHSTGTDTGYYYGFRILRVFRSQEGWAFRSYFVPLVDRIRLRVPTKIVVGQELEATAVAIQPFDPELSPRFGGAPHEPIRVELRAPDPARPDRAHLPEIAYMWKSSDPSVLAPVPAPDDPTGDPRFDAATMTTSGLFEARRPGTARLTIATGTHLRSVTVTVVRR